MARGGTKESILSSVLECTHILEIRFFFLNISTAGPVHELVQLTASSDIVWNVRLVTAN